MDEIDAIGNPPDICKIRELQKYWGEAIALINLRDACRSKYRQEFAGIKEGKMKKMNLIFIVAALLLAVWGCPPDGEDDPKPYYEVGTAFNRLHRDPDRACNYVSTHASTFDSRFESCGTSHVRGLQAEINRLQAECDALFLDPEWRLRCDEDRRVPERKQKVLYLSAVLEITNNTGGCVYFNCSCTNFGNYFQPIVNFFNSTAPLNKTWEQIMDESLEGHKQEYVCYYK